MALALFSLITSLRASESDELKARVKELHQEAKQLGKDGHAEEAADLKRQANKLLEKAERHEEDDRHVGPQQTLFKLNQQLGILRGQQKSLEISPEAERLAELRAAIQRTETEIRHLSQERRRRVSQERREGPPEHRTELMHRPRPVHHPELFDRGDQLHPHDPFHRSEPGHPELHRPEIHDGEHGPRHEIGQRLEHMRIAYQYLSMAGLHDIAQHVAERAAAAEAELHQHAEPDDGDAQHELIKQLEEMRHEMARLREEVRQLKK